MAIRNFFVTALLLASCGQSGTGVLLTVDSEDELQPDQLLATASFNGIMQSQPVPAVPAALQFPLTFVAALPITTTQLVDIEITATASGHAIGSGRASGIEVSPGNIDDVYVILRVPGYGSTIPAADMTAD